MVVMKTQIEICCKQETVSAFMDGQLPEAELSQALAPYKKHSPFEVDG